MLTRLVKWGLVDAVPDGLLVVDESGRIIYANRRMQELSGFDPADLVGESVELLVPENQRKSHARQREDYGIAGHPPRVMGVDLDTLLVRRDGTTLPVDIALSALDLDNETAIVATVRDATLRRELDASRKEFQRRLTELIENVELLVVGLDNEGRVFYVNPHVSYVTGYSPQEVLGTHWSEYLVDEADREEVQRMLREVRVGGGNAYYENRIRARRGRFPHIGWFNIRLLDPDGTVAGTWKIGADLTNRRLSEERLRAVNRVRQASLANNAEPEAVFNVIAVEAAALTEADLAMVVTGFNEEYTARGVAGSVGDRWQGTRLPKAAWREVFALGGATAFESAGPLLPPGEWDSLGPALVIPGLHIEAPAALLVTRSGGTFDDHDVITLEQLAGLAAVAKEHRETQERLRQMALLGDRNRIARDLHDVVIQKFFAAGLTIQDTLQKVQDDCSVFDRLNSVIESLDGAITELRGSIYALQTPQAGLYDEILDLITELTPALQFAPEVEVNDPGIEVPAEVVDECLSTLREVLTNIARHAEADQATVEIRLGSELELVVEDNGPGLPERVIKGRGLDNMEARARRLGGDFNVTGASTGGVRIEWRVPLS